MNKIQERGRSQSTRQFSLIDRSQWHTYATLQLNNGTDIYTVSKMLGHRHVKTTQRYTRLLEDKKRETTTRIVLEL